MTDYLNHEYIASAGREPADCGHATCGILCDVSLVAHRTVKEVAPTFNNADPAMLADRQAQRRCIVRLLTAGLTIKSTAFALHVSVKEVIHFLFGQHLDEIPYSNILYAESLLRIGDRSWVIVSQATGLDYATVLTLAHCIGVEYKNRWTWTPEQIADVKRLRSDGLSWSAVSRATGIGDKSCKRIWERAS